MIQVETILILADTNIEQHPSHLCSKATSVANSCYGGHGGSENTAETVDRILLQGWWRQICWTFAAVCERLATSQV